MNLRREFIFEVSLNLPLLSNSIPFQIKNIFSQTFCMLYDILRILINIDTFEKNKSNLKSFYSKLSKIQIQNIYGYRGMLKNVHEMIFLHFGLNYIFKNFSAMQ